MELHESIVRTLERAKDRCGMSTAELARRSGMHRLQLTNVFRRARTLKADELVRLCYVLGVSLQQLVPMAPAAEKAERNVHGDAPGQGTATRRM